jgi:hypothetical protein
MTREMDDPPDAVAATTGNRRRKVIVSLLVIHGALAVLSLIVTGTNSSGGPPWFPIELMVMTLAISQGSLLGIWAALGGPPAPWRLLATAAALVACMWLLPGLFVDADVEVWTYVVFTQMVGTSLPLLALRLRGLGIVRPTPSDPEPELQKLQFTLRSLLEWTTALAVLLGMVQMTPEDFREAFTSWQGGLEIVAIFGGDALLALAALWTALGARWTAARLLLLGLAGGVAATGIAVVDAPYRLITALAFLLLSVAWLVGSLWVFRVAGYRLAWRRAIRL